MENMRQITLWSPSRPSQPAESVEICLWALPKYLERPLARKEGFRGSLKERDPGPTSTYTHRRSLNELEVQNRLCSCAPSQRAVELRKVFPLLSFMQLVLRNSLGTEHLTEPRQRKAKARSGILVIPQGRNSKWWAWYNRGTEPYYFTYLLGLAFRGINMKRNVFQARAIAWLIS
jgi:hypothetical protein